MSKNITPQYCDANSILLVNKNGIIRKLYCPFQVKALKDFDTFSKEVVLWVDQVASNEKNQLVYWIFQKPYLISNFLIIARF